MPPVAQAVCGERTGNVGQPFVFDGGLSHDRDGRIRAYLWQLGEGQRGRGEVVTHSYSARGEYTVTLRVVDGCGAWAEDTLVVTVTEPDPCAGNEPPVADAGPDREAEVGENVLFEANDSTDPDGFIESFTWYFGDGHTDSGAAVTHAYDCADDYTVTLTVTDECGATDSREILVTVSPSEPQTLQADFKVYRLVYVDPVDGTEEWVEVDLENEEIELGLWVTFDAASSTGPAANYIWMFMDSTFDNTEQVLHAYDEPGDYDVTLTVYNDTWTESDTVAKTVHVAEGMHFVSMVSNVGGTFIPVDYTFLGDDLWGISATGVIGVVDISDVRAPGEVSIMETEPTLSVRSLVASSDNKLFVARGSAGIEVYRASRDAFSRLDAQSIPTEALGGNSAGALAVIDDVLYVRAYPSHEIYLFDTTNSASLGGALALPDGVKDMAPAGPDLLAVLGDTGTLAVLDVTTPANPVLVGDPIDLSAVSMKVGPTRIAARVSEGIALLDLDHLVYYASQGPDVQIPIAAVNTTDYAASEHYLYRVNGSAQTILKYCVVDPNASYLMEEIEAITFGMTEPCVHDPIQPPDGPDVVRNALLVQFSGGAFKVFKR